MTDKITDEQLMKNYAKGTQSAFALLYERHKGPLYRYFQRQLSQTLTTRAEELFQEVWFKVIDNRQSYEVKAKFTTWLYRIAHNLLIDEYRKEQRITQVVIETGDELNADPINKLTTEASVLTQSEQAVDNMFLQQATKHCIFLLSPLQRETFLLRYDAEFDPAAICEVLNEKRKQSKRVYVTL